MKNALVPLVFFFARTFIRYWPFSWGKEWVWKHLWYRIAGKTIAPRVVSTVYGVKMVAQPPDSIQTMILFTGRWEPKVSRYLHETLKPGDVVVDVGANVGHHTLLAARLVGPTGRVYAFEASPSIFQRLSRNVDMNHATNVVATNQAVASEAGQLEIWLAPSSNLGHSTTVSELAAKEGMALEAKIPADALDKLLPGMDLFNARVIKIDVEGAERDVLAPLSSQMSRFADSTEWLVELSPKFSRDGQSDIDWIFRLFIDNGYNAYAIPNPYDIGFYTKAQAPGPLSRLHAPPAGMLTDVLFSKRGAVMA